MIKQLTYPPSPPAKASRAPLLFPIQAARAEGSLSAGEANFSYPLDDLPRIPRISRTYFHERGGPYHAYHAYHAPISTSAADHTTHTTHITHLFPRARRTIPRISRISRTYFLERGAPYHAYHAPISSSAAHHTTHITHLFPRARRTIPRIPRTYFLERDGPYHAYHAYHAPFPSAALKNLLEVCILALYQGTTLQAAEKLGFRVGRGFIPGANAM